MTRAAALGVLAALLLLPAPRPAGAQGQEPPDVPSGPAVLHGQVRHAGSGDPVPEAPVVLYGLTQEGQPGLRRARSDAQGRFVFENISNAPDVAYLVGTRFQGVPYPGERIVFDGATERSVEIRVHPVTGDAGTLRLVERRLRFQPGAGRLAVAETLVVENAGQATYYTAPERREAEAPGLAVALPPGHAEFQMPLGVVPEGVERAGERVRIWGPVYPGRQEIRWFYALDAEAAEGSAEAELRPERFFWRADVAGASGRPEKEPTVTVELPAGETRLEARRGTLEAADEPSEPGLVRRTARPPSEGALVLVLETPPARTAASEDVVPVEVRLVLHVDAAAVEVTETHTLRVEREESVRAAPGASLHRIPLPAALSDLRFGAEAPGARLRPDGEGALAVTGTLPAGESRVELAYRLPVEGFPTAVERRFATRVPLLSVFLVDTGRLVPSSERLHRRRPVRTQDLTYAHLEAFEVEPGETVRLAVDRLPARTGLPRAGWLAVGAGLGALALGFLLVPLWRARAEGRLEPAPEPHETARERRAVYEAIRDLDHDFETGKVSAEDHAQLRAELRGQAVALLEQERRERGASEDAEDTGRTDGAAPGEEADAGDPAPPGCACGVRPRAGDRFCASCGAPVAGDGPPRAAAPRP